MSVKLFSSFLLQNLFLSGRVYKEREAMACSGKNPVYADGFSQSLQR